MALEVSARLAGRRLERQRKSNNGWADILKIFNKRHSYRLSQRDAHAGVYCAFASTS